MRVSYNKKVSRASLSGKRRNENHGAQEVLHAAQQHGDRGLFETSHRDEANSPRFKSKLVHSTPALWKSVFCTGIAVNDDPRVLFFFCFFFAFGCDFGGSPAPLWTTMQGALACKYEGPNSLYVSV